MSIYRKRLQNGVCYNHIATDRFKTGYFSVNFILPLTREDVSYYALLPRVMRCGCQTLPTRRDIVRRLEDLYGADIYVRHYGRGAQQIISFAADFLDNSFLPAGEQMDVSAETISVMRELMLAPMMKDGGFLDEYIQTEKQNCINAIRSMINNKQQYAVHRCTTLMCEGEPAGIPILGDIEDFEAVDAIKLTECYWHMLRHAQIEIFYVGASPMTVIERIATDLFTTCKRDYRLSDEPPYEPKRYADAIRTFEETTAAAQGKLVLGFRTGMLMQDREQLTYALFNEIYGSSPSSKLFLNVREKMSLCYSCFSTADLHKGLMHVIAGIENKNKDIAVEEIKKQLDNIQQSNVTNEEMYCAKQSLANAYRSLYDSADGLEAWYLRRILSCCVLTPEEAAERVMDITADAIATVARGVSLDTVYFLRGNNEDYFEADEDDE